MMPGNINPRQMNQMMRRLGISLYMLRKIAEGMTL